MNLKPETVGFIRGGMLFLEPPERWHAWQRDVWACCGADSEIPWRSIDRLVATLTVRNDRIPSIRGAPEVRIRTLKNGVVVLYQDEGNDEQRISLHAYQAAELAGYLWPADGPKPKLQ